jgi:membrane-associated phospholipid phosphatase
MGVRTQGAAFYLSATRACVGAAGSVALPILAASVRPPSAKLLSAWAIVATGVAAPVLRKRLRLAPPVTLLAAWSAPVAAFAALPRGRPRPAVVAALNMWAYLAAYKMPHDDPERLAARVHVGYPIKLDRLLGFGDTPTRRLQRAFSTPGQINRFERVLVWCHWLWFFVPHASVAYVLLRDPERLPSAAARMYAVFDTGAVFYWAIPTAPPWWAAQHGPLADDQTLQVRRMMSEYGEQFWEERWEGLYGLLGGNPLAAMPSLHFATSVMAAHLLSEVGPAAGAVGWTYATLLGLALVYLGEHYAIDLVAGAALTETIQTQAPRLAPLAARARDFLDGLAAR